jgi:hypothetical protein
MTESTDAAEELLGAIIGSIFFALASIMLPRIPFPASLLLSSIAFFAGWQIASKTRISRAIDDRTAYRIKESLTLVVAIGLVALALGGVAYLLSIIG